MGMDQRKGRIVADRADVAEMIGKAFELRHHAAQDGRPRRRRDAERCLDRQRKRKAERDGRIARCARDDVAGLRHLGAAEQTVDTLVHVAEPLLDPRHGLAVRGEAEMAGLDDPGMDRPDRDLVEAVAVHRQEVVIRRIAARRRRAGTKRRAQLPLAMIEPWAPVRRIRGNMAIEIADRAFEPDRRRMMRPDRRKLAGGDKAKSRRVPPPCGRTAMYDGIGIAPQREKIACARSERGCDRGPCRRIDLEAPPRRVAGRRGEAGERRSDQVRFHRIHPSCAATTRNHCTTACGSHSPAASTRARCTKAGT